MQRDRDYLDTGSGAGIDRLTLRPIVHDRAVFSAAMQTSGDPADLVVEALFVGDLDRASALVDAAGTMTFRLRVLEADIACARGDFAGATLTYETGLESASRPRWCCGSPPVRRRTRSSRPGWRSSGSIS